MTEADELQRFLDGAALLACGRVHPDEARWLAGALVEHPQWQEHVAAAEELARGVRDALAQREPDATSLPNFEEVMAGLPSTPRAREARPPSLRETLVRWWHAPGALGLATAAIAMLAIGLGVQTSRLQRARLAMDDAPVAWRGGEAEPMALLAIDFKPTSTIAQVDVLLAHAGLKIVDGPDANGTYLVRAPRERVDALLVSLRAQDVVVSVVRVVSPP